MFVVLSVTAWRRVNGMSANELMAITLQERIGRQRLWLGAEVV